LVLVLQRRHKKYKVRVVYITKASEKGKEVGWMGGCFGWMGGCLSICALEFDYSRGKGEERGKTRGAWVPKRTHIN